MTLHVRGDTLRSNRLIDAMLSETIAVITDIGQFSNLNTATVCALAQHDVVCSVDNEGDVFNFLAIRIEQQAPCHCSVQC